MNQKALHRNGLLGRRFMAFERNDVAHEHNHGILGSNGKKFDTYVHHALPMNVCIVSTEKMFRMTWFFSCF